MFFAILSQFFRKPFVRLRQLISWHTKDIGKNCERLANVHFTTFCKLGPGWPSWPRISRAAAMTNCGPWVDDWTQCDDWLQCTARDRSTDCRACAVGPSCLNARDRLQQMMMMMMTKCVSVPVILLSIVLHGTDVTDRNRLNCDGGKDLLPVTTDWRFLAV